MEIAWVIEDGNGTALTQGTDDERSIDRVSAIARRIAERDRRLVYVRYNDDRDVEAIYPPIPGTPCGLNADWIGRAWHVRGPGPANMHSGGVYLVQDDDDPDCWMLLRRWYVDDGNDIMDDLTGECHTFQDCMDVLATMPPEGFHGHPLRPR